VNDYPLIRPLNAMVGYAAEDANRLDKLLAKTEIPQDYELLSIDIDSYDLAVWNAYSGSPKVVVIEINSSIMPGLLQWHNGEKLIGNSFSSTLSVAKEKGYELACHTGNLIFVRAALVEGLELDTVSLNHPETLFLNNWLPSQKINSRSLLIARKILPASVKTAIKSILS